MTDAIIHVVGSVIFVLVLFEAGLGFMVTWEVIKEMIKQNLQK